MGFCDDICEEIYRAINTFCEGICEVIRMFSHNEVVSHNEVGEGNLLKPSGVFHERRVYADGFIKVYRCEKYLLNGKLSAACREELSRYELVGDNKVFIVKTKATDLERVPCKIIFAPTEQDAIAKYENLCSKSSRFGEIISIRLPSEDETKKILNNAASYWYAI